MKTLGICNVFENYEQESKGDEILLALHKAEVAYEYHSIKTATAYLDEAFESLQSSLIVDTIQPRMLIRLSVYLNRFSDLLRACMKNPLILQQDESIEAQIIRAYLACKNESFPLEEIMKQISDTDELSVFTYVVAQLIEAEDVKKSYLKIACKSKAPHLGALVELARLGEEISLLHLKKLYQNDETLFEEFFKVHRTHNTNRKLDFTFTPLGGGDDIGASCYLLQLGNENLLIDVGIKVKKEGEEYPDFEKLEALCPLEKITMVVITHAHLDHCGGILKLYKKNKNLTFVMTKETKELLRVNLGVNTGMEDYYLLEELLQKVVVLNFNESLRIGVEGMTMELYPAGHILGAAALWIQSSYGNIFMTSDYCLEHQHTVSGLEMRNLPVDVLITETTYGNHKDCSRFSRKQIEAELVDYVVEKINEGKKVLIPAFAIGRSQELIHMLKKAVKAHDFRLYIDGQVQVVNKIYEAESQFSSGGQNIYNVATTRYQDRADFITEEFLNNRSCVVTSSGMLEEGSASLEYAKQILGREDGVCILTGYQAGDTVGDKLKQQMKLACERYIEIEGVYYKIHAELTQFNLSAHCDIEDILAVATRLKPRHVILIHGECKTDKTYIHQVLEKVTHTVQSHNRRTIQIRED